MRVAEIVAMKRRNKEALDVEYESEPESEKEPNSGAFYGIHIFSPVHRFQHLIAFPFN